MAGPDRALLAGSSTPDSAGDNDFTPTFKPDSSANHARRFSNPHTDPLAPSGGSGTLDGRLIVDGSDIRKSRPQSAAFTGNNPPQITSWREAFFNPRTIIFEDSERTDLSYESDKVSPEGQRTQNSYHSLVNDSQPEMYPMQEPRRPIAWPSLLARDYLSSTLNARDVSVLEVASRFESGGLRSGGLHNLEKGHSWRSTSVAKPVKDGALKLSVSPWSRATVGIPTSHRHDSGYGASYRAKQPTNSLNSQADHQIYNTGLHPPRSALPAENWTGPYFQSCEKPRLGGQAVNHNFGSCNLPPTQHLPASSQLTKTLSYDRKQISDTPGFYIPNARESPTSTVDSHSQGQHVQWMQAPGMQQTRSQLDTGRGSRSLALELFREQYRKGTPRCVLRDIYGHVVEFSSDQHGSRFIQDKLALARLEEKATLFFEIAPCALQLMKDVFGNYVIQKFFELGDDTQKSVLVHAMKGSVMELSMNLYGCRVVQKALEYARVEQQAVIVQELHSRENVLSCVEDRNGNHVIQVAISRVPGVYTRFITDIFVGQICRLAVHQYGCRVVQRMLEWSEEPMKTLILQEIHARTDMLIPNAFGNYVTQHIVEHGEPEHRNKVIGHVLVNIVGYSKHKFASNVVEKCLVWGTHQHRHEALLRFLAYDERGNSLLPALIRDHLQITLSRLLDTLVNEDRATLVNNLVPALQSAREDVPAKSAQKVAEAVEIITRKLYSTCAAPMLRTPWHVRPAQ